MGSTCVEMTGAWGGVSLGQGRGGHIYHHNQWSKPHNIEISGE